MTTIEQMARDVGAVIESRKAPMFETLVAFAVLVREARDAELLAGVGEPVAWWIPKHTHPDLISRVRWSDECKPLYTDSQVAAAVLAERERVNRGMNEAVQRLRQGVSAGSRSVSDMETEQAIAFPLLDAVEDVIERTTK